jgi:lipopolysaccharide export system protein LptA
VLPAATDTAAKPPAKRAERPAQRCTLDFENTPETRAQSIRDPISQKYTTYIGGGVIGICRGQATRIVGDSAESYEQNRLHYLIGHVKYRDDQVVLDADRVTYFQGEERLLAEGNVVVTMKDSSSMTGPRAEYLRAVRGVRPASRVLMNARPTLRMYETDSAGKRQPDPVVLIADNIVGEGESLFVANGNVQLDRVDLKARGDSGLLDNVRQYARLMKGPQVESKGSQPFTLTGRIVDVFGRSRRIERVLSLDSAQAVSKDLTLTADTLDLRVTENKLNRAYAFGAGQANAVTPERRIVADSLDVVMPNQRLRELHAVGSAYADSDPDSAKITSTDRDWMRGDTIVARFDTVARDTTSQPALRDLKASGNASSFYQMPSQRGDKQRPGLSYVRGREITIDFNDREVQTVAVTDSVAGVFLEASPPVDSSKVDAKPSNRRRTPARPPARGTTPVRRPGGPRE